MFTVAGTGSRSLCVDGNFNRVLEFLSTDTIPRTLEARGEMEIVAGGAEGFDHCLALAAQVCEVPYDLYIPSRSYGTYYWRDHSYTGRDRMHEFDEMVAGARQVLYICESHQGGKANFVRNQAMVNAADKMWVWKPTSRGTAHAVRLCESSKTPYYEIELP